MPGYINPYCKFLNPYCKCLNPIIIPFFHYILPLSHQPKRHRPECPVLEERGHLPRRSPGRSHVARRLRQTLEQGGRDGVLGRQGVRLEMPCGRGKSGWNPLFVRLKILKMGGEWCRNAGWCGFKAQVLAISLEEIQLKIRKILLVGRWTLWKYAGHLGPSSHFE